VAKRFTFASSAACAPARLNATSPIESATTKSERAPFASTRCSEHAKATTTVNAITTGARSYQGPEDTKTSGTRPSKTSRRMPPPTAVRVASKSTPSRSRRLRTPSRYPESAKATVPTRKMRRIDGRA